MFATLTTTGSASASTQTDRGPSLRAIRRDDDQVLDPVLLAPHQLLPEVIVDRGVGAAPGRAGERDGRDAGAAAADEQLRAGADERRLGRTGAEAEAGWKQLPEGAEEGRRVVRRAGLDHDLAGEHDLLEPAVADLATASATARS